MAMPLLFYADKGEKNSQRLEAAVHKIIPEDRIEHFKSLKNFRERLRKPVEPDSIAVLLASNRKELQQMQLLRGLLTEIYVVLVLPDLQKPTIKNAHHLLPRFLSQKDSNFEDLKKVINKMYINSQASLSQEISRRS
jgi:hypothetical protein